MDKIYLFLILFIIFIFLTKTSKIYEKFYFPWNLATRNNNYIYDIRGYPYSSINKFCYDNIPCLYLFNHKYNILNLNKTLYLLF